MDKNISKLTQKSCDFDWLERIARNKSTKTKVKEILKWNKEVENGIFRDSIRTFSLKLDKHLIWIRESEAWFSLHLYSHIFKDREHIEVPGFDGVGSNVVIDLGANIGLYTLAIKNKNPLCTVIAVEPNPLAYELLSKNIISNNLKKVQTMNCAVAKKKGHLKIKTLSESSAYGGKYLGSIKKECRTWINEDRVKEISVESVTLPNIFKKCKIKKADILKMDIEGMELEVLLGGVSVLDKINKIVIEWHDINIKKQIIDLLNKKGFLLVYEEPRSYGNIYFSKRQELI
jgi:FkbM family methyltransferase